MKSSTKENFREALGGLAVVGMIATLAVGPKAAAKYREVTAAQAKANSDEALKDVRAKTAAYEAAKKIPITPALTLRP